MHIFFFNLLIKFFFCVKQYMYNVAYLPMAAQMRQVGAKLYQTKVMAPDGNSDLQKQVKGPRKEKKRAQYLIPSTIACNSQASLIFFRRFSFPSFPPVMDTFICQLGWAMVLGYLANYYSVSINVRLYMRLTFKSGNSE